MDESQDQHGRIEGIEARIGAVESAVVDIRDDIGSLRQETKPLVDALTTMEAGIRTIGRIGKLGEKFGRAVLFLIACGVMVKFIFGGASWSDVSGAIARAFGR